VISCKNCNCQLSTGLAGILCYPAKIIIITPLKELALWEEEIHSHKDFIVKLAKRAKLLYEMLFDAGFPKSRTTEKTIAAGLL